MPIGASGSRLPQTGIFGMVVRDYPRFHAKIAQRAELRQLFGSTRVKEQKALRQLRASLDDGVRKPRKQRGPVPVQIMMIFAAGSSGHRERRAKRCTSASRHASREGLVRPQGATVRPSFTLFEASSINFAIVVYSECVQVDGRLA
jgi:hypothetical protein